MYSQAMGTRIYYEYIAGDQSGIPLVMLHGWGCDSSFFQWFSQRFASQCPILLIDFPGHGQSDEPNCTWTVEDFMRQVIALMDELNIEKANLIAHSFGGRVAIKLASMHPDRIEKMILTGGAGLRAPKSKEQTEAQKRYHAIQNVLNQIKKFKPFSRPVEAIQRKYRDTHSSPDYRALSEGMKKTFVAVINEDLSDALPNIKASTLLVWGDHDTETPLWMGQKMESLIPDAGLVIFEGATHFAFLEQKERFEVIAKAFLIPGKES